MPGLALVAALLMLPACDPSHRCGADQLCLFADNGMRGPMVAFTDDEAAYAGVGWDGPGPDGSDGPAGPDDAASSISNDTDSWVLVYVDPDRRGPALCLGPQAFVEDLEAYDYDAFGHTFGDAASSHELRTTRPRAARRGGPCNHVVTGDDVVAGGGWDRPPGPAEAPDAAEPATPTCSSHGPRRPGG